MYSRVLAHRLRLSVVAAIAVGLIGLCGWLFAINWRPAPGDFPVQGIDVSAAQGPIEWWPVKNNGVAFAYIRATSGATERDLRFTENWRSSFETGIKRGAIHVYSLCQLAADQAGNFTSTVARTDDQLPPAVELEFQDDCPARPDRAVMLGELGRFLHAVETHIGQPAVLLVGKDFEARYGVGDAFDRVLWSRGAFFPPSYFARPWTIWQATSFRRIDGVSGPVNWNVMAR